MRFIWLIATPLPENNTAFEDEFAGLQDGVDFELAADAQASTGQFRERWPEYDYRLPAAAVSHCDAAGSCSLHAASPTNDPWQFSFDDEVEVTSVAPDTVSFHQKGQILFAARGTNQPDHRYGWDNTWARAVVGQTYGVGIIGLPSGERIIGAFCVVVHSQ